MLYFRGIGDHHVINMFVSEVCVDSVVSELCVTNMLIDSVVSELYVTCLRAICDKFFVIIFASEL